MTQKCTEMTVFTPKLDISRKIPCIFSVVGELFVIFNDLLELTVDWLVFLVNRFCWLILVGFEFGEVGFEEHFLKDFLIFGVF